MNELPISENVKKTLLGEKSTLSFGIENLMSFIKNYCQSLQVNNRKCW